MALPSHRLRRWLRVSTYWDCVYSFAEFSARRARRLLNRLIDLESLRPSKPKKRSYWPVLNTGQTWHNAGGSVAGYETFTYDGDGNQLTAANANGTYTLTYNAVAEVTNELGPFGADLTMTYDADGNRTVVQDQFGGVTTSMYDGDGDLTEEETGGVGLTPLRINFAYNADGEMTSEIRYSNLAGTTVVATTSLVYDAAGNVTGQVDKTGGGTSIASYTNIYDANNEITSEQLNGGARTTYTYDADGEVTSDGTNTETYDGEGNRTDAGDTTTTGNELETDGTWDYKYDAAGNETEKINIATGVAWTYGYDDKNELVKAQEWSMNPTVYGTAYVEVEVDYKYDAYGNLLESDSYPTGSGSPVVTRYQVDGWNPALAGTTGNSRFNVFADLDGSNNLQTRYLRGDKVDQLLARIDNAGNAYWTLTDRQGSVRDVIDNSGNVKDAINYDAFGNIISETNSAYRGSYAWTGRELDVETDLQYNRARWYDPATARWMSQDPRGFDAGDSNLYRYVKNQPTNALDSSGLQSTTLSIKALISEDLLTVWNQIKADAKTVLNQGRKVVDAILNANLPGTLQAFTALVNPLGKLLNPTRYTHALIGAVLYTLWDESSNLVASSGGGTDKDGNVTANAPTIALTGTNEFELPFFGKQYGYMLVPSLQGAAKEPYNITATMGNNVKKVCFEFYHARFGLNLELNAGATGKYTVLPKQSFAIFSNTNFPKGGNNAQMYLTYDQDNQAEPFGQIFKLPGGPGQTFTAKAESANTIFEFFFYPGYKVKAVHT